MNGAVFHRTDVAVACPNGQWVDVDLIMEGCAAPGSVKCTSSTVSSGSFTDLVIFRGNRKFHGQINLTLSEGTWWFEGANEVPCNFLRNASCWVVKMGLSFLIEDPVCSSFQKYPLLWFTFVQLLDALLGCLFLKNL